MITLQQHVPTFVNDGDGGWKVSAPDLATLLSNPKVAAYAHDTEPVERRGTVRWIDEAHEWRSVEVIHPAPAARRFHQWSVADGNKLMVEFNGGDWLWVVGFLRPDEPVELASLPTWRETDAARQRRERWNRGDTGPAPKPYRCAEHGVDNAACCIERR